VHWEKPEGMSTEHTSPTVEEIIGSYSTLQFYYDPYVSQGLSCWQSPGEILGRKVDCKINERVGFGQYVQVFNNDVVTKTMQERTTLVIALYPTWALYSTGNENFSQLDDLEDCRNTFLERASDPKRDCQFYRSKGFTYRARTGDRGS